MGNLEHVGNKKVVQRQEWVGLNTVIITYQDGTKEQMTSKVFDQMIREVK